jgi:hypothetical protein
MTLDIQDFVAQEDGVSLEDVPPVVQERLNDALADLTGGVDPGDGPTGPSGDLSELVVSAERGTEGGDPYATISGALDDATSGDVIFVESGTYDDEDTFDGKNGLQIGSQDVGTDPESAPLAGVSIVGQGRPTIDGWVQILDPGVTLEGFEVTGEVFEYGVAAFEPGVTIRDVTVTGVTNGLFVPSAESVLIEACTVKNYSYYGLFVSGRGEFGGSTPTVRDTTVDGTSGDGTVGIGVLATSAVVRSNTVTGNKVESNDGAGVAHFSGPDTVVQQNVVAGNDDGLFFAGSDAASVTATRNDIVGNRIGVANEASDASAPVTATSNWWGSPDGPSAESSTNDTGTQGPVNVDPWSTASGPDWNSDGVPGTDSASGNVSLQTASVGTSGNAGTGVPSPPTNPDPVE